MSPERQIVRLMAAMILAIIAYVAPSAVQAHEGHAHHGHHVAAPQPKVVPATARAAVTVPVRSVVRSQAPTWSKVALTTVEPSCIEPTGDDCCRPGCQTRCCGTMACGVGPGILPATSALSQSLFRTVTLIPRDVAGRSGPGPEALPKPPRTLA